MPIDGILNAKLSFVNLKITAKVIEKVLPLYGQKSLFRY